MGIQRFNGVGINSNRATPCAGGAFNVRVLVIGVTGVTGGTYDVAVYDDDFGFDTLLDQKLNVRAPAGGVFRQRHTFTLNCDARCNVQGPLDNSNENPANIYAYVEEQAIVFAATGQSRRINLTCTVPEEDAAHDFAPDGGEIVAGDVSVELPGGAVTDTVSVPIGRQVPDLDEEFFPGVIGTDISVLGIGGNDLKLAKPARVRWTLNGGERRRLEELDGCVVAYDPESRTWRPVDGVDHRDDQVVFTITAGGLFGIAPHIRYDVDDELFRRSPTNRSEKKKK